MTNQGNNSTSQHGTCNHCTYCNVQTGMGWNPVFFCEKRGYAQSVNAGDTCDDFEREPGVDDEKVAQ